jgi:ABC-type Fe3+/spermidine/putrescine transport system ATPase subunit
MNVLLGRVEGPGQAPGRLSVVMDFGERWQVQATGTPGQPISIGIRPESLQLLPGGNGTEAWNALQGTVTEVVYLGPVVRYQLRVAEEIDVTAEIHNPDFSAIHTVGDRLTLWFAAGRAVGLPGEAGRA